jgi:hypothetical protein
MIAMTTNNSTRVNPGKPLSSLGLQFSEAAVEEPGCKRASLG